MKKAAGVLALCFVIYIAFLQFNGVKSVEGFSISGYIERLQQVEPMPDLPSFSADYGTDASANAGFFAQAKKFFMFIGDVITYPFRVLYWFFKTAALLLVTDPPKYPDPFGGGGQGGGGGGSW